MNQCNKFKNVIIITDYRNHLFESVKYIGCSINVNKISSILSEYGYSVNVVRFSDINFIKNSYSNCYVLYQSVEDNNMLYKDYIEDILLGLTLQGAILIPDIYKFRSHHNKVFMEILRSLSNNKDVNNVKSWYYGTFEEYKAGAGKLPDKVIMKPASGARGKGVKLMCGKKQKDSYAKILSSSFSLKEYMANMYNRYKCRLYIPKSTHRRKFVAQEYIEGLCGDFKILVYGRKYYVLYRHNRHNDIRASGSGMFQFPNDVNDKLLDYAYSIFKYFNVPFISMDIAHSDNMYRLMEFQFVSFGNYTIEKSSYYYTRDSDGRWVRITEDPDLEREFAQSVIEYIGMLK